MSIPTDNVRTKLVELTQSEAHTKDQRFSALMVTAIMIECSTRWKRLLSRPPTEDTFKLMSLNDEIFSELRIRLRLGEERSQQLAAIASDILQQFDSKLATLENHPVLNEIALLDLYEHLADIIITDTLNKIEQNPRGLGS